MDHPFFTSDTHFCHSNVIRHSSRPFQDVEEMNEAFIENINKTVPREHPLYHIGDFALAKKFEEIEPILDRIHARLHLVFGNHDYKFRNQYTEYLNGRTCDYLELKHNNEFMILCHFPFFSWNKSHYGSTNIHGHCHGAIDEINEATNVRRIDVGVDGNNYCPVSFVEIMEKLRGRGTVHHHQPEPIVVTGT